MRYVRRVIDMRRVNEHVAEQLLSNHLRPVECWNRTVTMYMLTETLQERGEAKGAFPRAFRTLDFFERDVKTNDQRAAQSECKPIVRRVAREAR